MDDVTAYAEAVTNGEFLAGPHVRDAAAKHLTEIKTPPAGFFFDHEAAEHAFEFFAEVLCLNGGAYEGKPFILLPWQKFIVGSLFGWKSTATKKRRFRIAYVETGKGSGKSPLAAGIGLYGLVADGESRAEVYAAASKKDQAMVLFRDAVAMVDLSPALTGEVQKTGGPGREWNLASLKTRSFFRPISSDDSQSGPRPHFILLDEIHEHRTGSIVETLQAGTKWRQQPLVFMITNSGTDRSSVCWEYHDYAAKIAAGTLTDPTFFSYVCSFDEGQDPFAVEETEWEKANPSLRYGLPGYDYLREQITRAAGIPSRQSVVRRLCFCEWVQSDSPLFDAHVWMRAGEPADLADYAGRRAYAGLDLSSSQDLSALAVLIEPQDSEPWRLFSFFWIPGDALAEKEIQDRVPYSQWAKNGAIEAPPGRATSRPHVLSRIVELLGAFELAAVGVDRWRIDDLVTMADAAGIDLPLVPVGQGYQTMSPALEEFERRLINGDLLHNNNPALTWCIANAVADIDPAGNRKLTKRRATGRIDGAVAALIATSVSLSADVAVPSVYETRGILTL